MKLRAVFFDAGHTLLHAHPTIGDIYAREAAALGVNVDPSVMGAAFSRVFAQGEASLASRSIGAPASDEQDAEMWRSIVERVQAETPELEKLDAHAWYLRLYECFGDPALWRLYPDVKPALTALKSRGLTLGIISNWSTRLFHIAKETGLEALVDFIVASSEAGARKPDPRIFRAALDKAGVDAGETAHIGDQVEDDVRGAQRMGIHPVFLWRKPGSPPALDGTPVIRDLAELPRLID